MKRQGVSFWGGGSVHIVSSGSIDISLQGKKFIHLYVMGFYVMGLLQLHKVCKLGEDELHRPPMVALKSWVLFSHGGN